MIGGPRQFAYWKLPTQLGRNIFWFDSVKEYDN